MSKSTEIVNLDEGLELYDDTRVWKDLTGLLWRHAPPPLYPGQTEEDTSDPELPSNLDLMWVDDLRKVQKDFGRWLGYRSDQKTIMMTTAAKLKAQLDFVENYLYTQVYLKGSQKAREAALRTDRSYVEVHNNYVDTKALLAAINNRIDTLTRHLDIVSRQITVVMGNPENDPIPRSDHHGDTE